VNYYHKQILLSVNQTFFLSIWVVRITKSPMEFVNVCGVSFFIIELEKLEIVDVEAICLLVSRNTSFEKSCNVLFVVLLILLLRLRLSLFDKSIK